MINQEKLIERVKACSMTLSLFSKKSDALFHNVFIDTLTNTVKIQNDSKIFVATGDIPAMWLRDSTFQVLPYLSLIKEIPEITQLIHGVINQQLTYIRHDPYANAFNETSSGAHYTIDQSNIPISDLVWERKFEIDSLCAPIHLASELYQKSGYSKHLDINFWQTINLIVDTFIKEQHHETSDYIFKRSDGPATDTLSHKGKGSPIGYTGMVWSGFRPSDDACQYGYHIPGNSYIVCVLDELLTLSKTHAIPNELIKKIIRLRSEVAAGIENFGIVPQPNSNETIFAYEVDGLGHVNLMDDANVPSLLSLPFLGYVSSDNALYQRTRTFILSNQNPFYYSGSYLKGIGSPHTPKNYIWPISLAMEGLTSNNPEVMKSKLDIISQSDNDTLQCHEGIDVNDPSNFTRDWFSWANMTYCQLALRYLNK
ncbi:glycoside hydrolase family 125 protein [Dellaglioa sp. L3N]